MTEVGPGTIDGPLDEPRLSHLVQRGLRWSFGGIATIRVVTFLSGLIMARVLSPRDFGIFAAGGVALTVTASINDIGIEPTLVRWPGSLSKLAPTAMTIVMASSVVIFAIFWFLAPAFADLLSAPASVGVVRVMSVGLIISGAFTVQSALATREFRQHVRMAAEVSGALVTIALTLGLALLGVGVYSLAIGHIVGNMVVGIVLFAGAPVRYRPGFDRSAATELLRSGLPLAGAGLLGALILNVDYLLVGGILGATALGIYLLAWNLSSWPINLVSAAVNRVSVPGFARLQHNREALARGFTLSLRAVTAATFPFCALLAALSLPAVTVLYGDKWTAAAVPLHFLAVVAGVRAATLLGHDVLVAGGWGHAALGLQGFWLVLLVPALTVGAHVDGLRGVGIGYVAVSVLAVTPAFLFVLGRKGFAPRRVARSVAPALFGAIVAAALAVAISSLTDNNVVKLVLGSAVGLGGYLLVIRHVWLPPLQTHLANRRVRAA